MTLLCEWDYIEDLAAVLQDEHIGYSGSKVGVLRAVSMNDRVVTCVSPGCSS